MDSNKIISVYNRHRGRVQYSVADLGVRRVFVPGETKKVPFEELEKLSFKRGGYRILKDDLIIQDKEAVEALLGEVEPEYYYTEPEIVKILTEGSYDQLLDCLDFAPAGVLDLIKDVSVKIKLNDVAKREAIKNKLRFNVDKAIEIDYISKQDVPEKETKTTRRATPMKTETESKEVKVIRRVEPTEK